MTIGKTVLLAAVLVLSAPASGESELPANAGYGPKPTLPAPDKSLIPTVDIAPAVGWPAGRKPVPMRGAAVNAFAAGLVHPRWIHVLPNGDVLVAESNAPERPDHDKGIRNKIMKRVMSRAGAGVPSPDRITLLRDADGDGTAEVRSVLLKDLKSPFGMAQVGDQLYVANTDGVVKFPHRPGALQIDGQGTPVAPLPAGSYNHHWTKNILASPDGRRLYATVGSNSNVAEMGMAMEEGRAAIWEIDLATGRQRLFASGLRNPNGLAIVPSTGALWTVVNERDEIGDDLVPDYMTSVKDGGFYGWPYSYFGQNVDVRVEPQRPELVTAALVPDYALGSHTGSLGLAFADGEAATWMKQPGMFVGQHGSWNRKPLVGYRVIFIPFVDGKPSGLPVEVLTGFLSEDDEAYGRPVGVALNGRGGLLVADDVGNVIWRVSGATPASSSDPV